jgi:hypothetical protein
MAESGERPGFLKRLYQTVREALRKLGFTVKFTDGDIQAVIGRAQEFMKEGDVNVSITSDLERRFSLREAQVPASDWLFKWLGVAPGKIYADYAALQKKHPEHFTTPEDVKAHVEHVLSGPTVSMEASKPEYTLLVKRNGKDRAAVVEFRLRGGKYRVRSAYVMNVGQLEVKIEKLRAQGGRVSTVLVKPTFAALMKGNGR